MDVRQVEFAAVKPYAARAAREHVSISDTRGTRWYEVKKGDKTAAIAGLLKTSHGYRVKGVYVLPEERGTGIGTKLTEYLIAQCANEFAMVEVFAYNPAFYEARGFTRYGQLPNGAIKLRKPS